jgi:hypothetical protein
MPRRIAGVLAGCVLALLPVAATAQSAAADVCNLRTTERVVAVGDVHGAYEALVSILEAAGLTDQRGRWRGGRAVLVQTGDILDRGPDSRRALDLLRRLERDAARAGGAVHSLLGNHELMRMIGDWRYVSEGELNAFRTNNSAEFRERVYTAVEENAAARAAAEKRPHDAPAFRERFVKEVPLGFIEMQNAFGPAGDYGKWLRGRPVAVKINDVLYVHGGISAQTAPLGCTGINAAVRSDLTITNPTPEQIAAMLGASETGPLWYRGLAEEPEEAFAPTAASIAKEIGARMIVVGHTVTEGFRIRPRFGGRVLQIDTGMLDGTFYPGGAPSAIEIRGNVVTAIYLTARERITALPD